MTVSTHEATVHVAACDFPGCYAEDRSYADKSGHGTRRGDDWKLVRLGEGFGEANLVILCPEHAHHADTVRLIGMLQQRQTQSERGEGLTWGARTFSAGSTVT